MDANLRRTLLLFTTYSCHGPFEKAYSTPAYRLKNILDYIEKLCSEPDLTELMFGNVEQAFIRHRGKDCRMILVHILSYAPISGHFDNGIFTELEALAPNQEVKIKSTFSPEEIYFE